MSNISLVYLSMSRVSLTSFLGQRSHEAVRQIGSQFDQFTFVRNGFVVSFGLEGFPT